MTYDEVDAEVVRNESRLSFEIDIVEKNLASLYEKRRGLSIRWVDFANTVPSAVEDKLEAIWCQGCGRNAIFVSDTGKLCEDCQLTVEVETQNCPPKK